MSAPSREGGEGAEEAARACGDPGGLPGHWEGEPIRVWERLWEVPLLEVHERIGSTNDRIRELGEAGAAPFTTVIAEEQRAGRGRSGRSWHSPPGAGLWLSVLVRPPGAGAPPPLASLLAGVAAARAIEAVAPGIRAAIKWPNDMLIAGRKVCGILCEASGGGRLVVGVGVNVRQQPADFPEEIRDRATSLEAEVGKRVSRGRLAGLLIREMRRLFLGGPGERLPEEVIGEVRRRDALRGRRVRVSGGGEGVARGVTDEGALRVETEAGERLVLAGSVWLLGGEEGA